MFFWLFAARACLFIAGTMRSLHSHVRGSPVPIIPCYESDADDCSIAIATSSAKCNSVQKPHAILPDTPGDLTSASKYFQTLPDPPGAKHSALRLCKSIIRCPWKHLELWRCFQDAASGIVKFWRSWDLSADLRDTSSVAETAAQLCGTIDAVFSQQWLLHNHKVFRLIIFIFVTVTRFTTS